MQQEEETKNSATTQVDTATTQRKNPLRESLRKRGNDKLRATHRGRLEGNSKDLQSIKEGLKLNVEGVQNGESLVTSPRILQTSSKIDIPSEAEKSKTNWVENLTQSKRHKLPKPSNIFSEAQFVHSLDQVLPTDVTLVQGQLPNKLKYFVKSNPSPSKSIYLRLLVKVGSVCEKVNEKGYAHLIEHLAFDTEKKTEVVEPIIQYMADNGLIMGADTNALTHFDYTEFFLECPAKEGGKFESETEECELFERALQVLCSWTTFDATARKINAEKKVVIEENRLNHDENFSRLTSLLHSFVFRNTPYEDREVIGDMNVISEATEASLKEFFYRWYVPDNMAVLIVGDIANTDRVVNLIHQRFSQLQHHESIPPGVWPSFSSFDPNGPFRVEQMDNPEATLVSFSLILAEPFPACKTVRDYFREYARFLLSVALTNLLSLHAENPTLSGIESASISDFSWSFVGLIQSHSIECPIANFKTGLKNLFSEWAGLIKNTVTTEDMFALIDWTQNTLMTRKSPSSPIVMDELVIFALYQKVTTNVNLDLELHNIFKKYITPEILLNEWKNGQQVLLNVIYPASVKPEDRLTDKEIIEMFEVELRSTESTDGRKKINLKTTDVTLSQSIPDVVDYSQVQELEYKLQLINGVNVVIKEEANNNTDDYQANFDEYISINVTSKFGEAYSVGYVYTETPEQIHSAFLAPHMVSSFSWGGIKTPNKLTDRWFLTDFKVLTLQNSFTLITADTDDLELLFKILYCYFNEVTTWNRDLVAQEVEKLVERKKKHIQTPEEHFARKVLEFNYKSHPLLSDVVPERFDTDDCLAFLGKAFSNASEYIFTISVPYGFSRLRDLINVAIRYMTSFNTDKPSVTRPQIAKLSNILGKELALAARDPNIHAVVVKNPTKGFVQYTFQHLVPSNQLTYLWIIIEIFRNKLNDTLRHYGLTYSVEFNSPSSFYDTVVLHITCEPHHSRLVLKKVSSILKQFSEQGFSDQDIVYANKVASKRRCNVLMDKENTFKLFRAVFVEVPCTLVFLIPKENDTQGPSLGFREPVDHTRTFKRVAITSAIAISLYLTYQFISTRKKH
eukprot:TRINITY_DN4562_c0_g1_i1.p1 TRINITY_DN4562_c0_g1~~TRINITY_DN4562_c0_g1_i1.p1  ORF type:complete len:1078 (-),score=223.05 TRINITY_DN4562_c0_g1_i1:64-3297(-)